MSGEQRTLDGAAAHPSSSVPSLLLVSAVPRQLLLVEVDDDLGTPGAGLTGRQQGHILGVLPAGKQEMKFLFLQVYNKKL